MKRLQYHNYGGPDEVRLEEFESAKPRAGQILVRVRAASVNPVDWKIRSGALKFMTGKRFPRAMGSDFSGIAGIMALPCLEQRYGLEKQFVVNYLGHFMLITGILEAIPRHAGARVVILSSSAHKRAPSSGIEFDNLSGERGYKPWVFYGQSNVARILFTRALARRLSGTGITVNTLHPGVIADTSLSRHLSPLIRAITPVIRQNCSQYERGLLRMAN